jgi:hypothetical protein
MSCHGLWFVAVKIGFVIGFLSLKIFGLMQSKPGIFFFPSLQGISYYNTANPRIPNTLKTEK